MDELKWALSLGKMYSGVRQGKKQTSLCSHMTNWRLDIPKLVINSRGFHCLVSETKINGVYILPARYRSRYVLLFFKYAKRRLFHDVVRIDHSNLSKNGMLRKCNN